MLYIDFQRAWSLLLIRRLCVIACENFDESGVADRDVKEVFLACAH
jgi:hypothetical protein